MATHAVHHAAKDLNIVVSYRRHPAAFVFRSTTLCGLTFLGFPLGALVAAFLIRHAYTLWVHSDLPTSNFVERWIAFGPRGHGIHHGTDQSCFDSNYGDLVIGIGCLARINGTFPSRLSTAAPTRRASTNWDIRCMI